MSPVYTSDVIRIYHPSSLVLPHVRYEWYVLYAPPRTIDCVLGMN